MSEPSNNDYDNNFPLEILGRNFHSNLNSRPWILGAEKAIYSKPKNKFKTFYNDWRFQIGAITAGIFSLIMIIVIK